jgi:2-polyprenyl-6-methoxyphenol hydroxylase-like FAD-dependent oxidoreductase
MLGWCARLATTVPTLAGSLAATVTAWDRVLVLRHHVVRPVTWSRGQVALLGDSAHGVHSFAAQGVNLGIQDAVALARALRDADDPPAAFAAYERLRRPFVEEFQAYQPAMPQPSGTGAGHLTLYGGIAGLLTHGQPELDVTWLIPR